MGCVFGCCGCCFCFREVWLCCKDRSKGDKNLRDNRDVRVRYTVQSQRKTTVDGKVHVVWDISDADMESLLAAAPAGAAASGDIQRSGSTVGRDRFSSFFAGSPADRRSRKRSFWQRGTTRLFRESTLVTESNAADPGVSEQLYPMFLDGQAVEYWSRQKRAWLPGSVKTVLHKDSEGMQVVFHVRPHASQLWRANIPADCIRAQLRASEPVQVFTGGSWKPGEVVSVEGVGAAFGLRYNVELVGAAPSDPLERVLSSQVRRRFPEGSSVEVYRDLRRGWETAVVCQEAVDTGGPDQVAVQVDGGPSELLESRLLRIPIAGPGATIEDSPA